jgi:hypothetical protein
MKGRTAPRTPWGEPDLQGTYSNRTIPFVTTGEEMYEYACHEGNYGMLGILRGAREEERRER